MLIETFSGVWLNPERVVNYQIGVSDGGKDHCTILAEVDAWRGYGTVASFDTRELAAAGMRRLAHLLAEPGRSLITQEDIHRESIYESNYNLTSNALAALIQDLGGKYHVSAEQLEVRPDDGDTIVVRHADGSVEFDWQATPEGMARQQARWDARATGIASKAMDSIRQTDQVLRDMAKIVPDPDAPPLKYRVGWKDDTGKQFYDPSDCDADFDTAKSNADDLRSRGEKYGGAYDVHVYLVHETGTLEPMED